MSDQNNNDQSQPQQPIQPAQPGQPQQGQPQQPYQPYQGQPQQPYQPYQGQPQQQYQPYQGQPQQQYQPYQPYQGQPPVPPKKKSKWWIWLIVAAVVILGVVALFVFGVINLGGIRHVGNEGAWKAYDYFNAIEDKMDRIASSTQKELTSRLDTEAFEMDGEFKLESDLFDTADLGINRFGADFEVKYDLKDLGVKLDLFDTVSANVYLIEEDIAVSILGEAYATSLDPNTDVDLSDKMPLKDRISALNSLSADDDFKDLFEKLMAELAPVIPDGLTEKDTVDVYSPLEDDEVEMQATTTTLEKEDIYDIIVAFGENLENNDELIDELQSFLDSIASATDEDMDVDDIIDDMIDLDEDELDEYDDITFSWSIYTYKGEDVGISVYFDNGEEQAEIYLITEYTNNAVYSSVIVYSDDEEFMNLISERAYDGDDMSLDVQILITTPEDDYSEAQQFEINLSGNTTIEKQSSTEYGYSADFTVDIDAGSNMSAFGLDGPVSIDIELSADCLFGNDLGMIEDDDDWNEIYDQDWGDIEDIFNAFGGFGGFGGMNDFDGVGDFTF